MHKVCYRTINDPVKDISEATANDKRKANQLCCRHGFILEDVIESKGEKYERKHRKE